jgi:hypothetical protein
MSEVNRATDTPSLETLKSLVIEVVNRVLASGRVQVAYITDYLAF